jgi:hypothetical protein
MFLIASSTSSFLKQSVLLYITLIGLKPHIISQASMLLADQMDVVRLWGQVLSLIFCSAAYIVAAFVVLPRLGCCRTFFMCFVIVVDAALTE